MPSTDPKVKWRHIEFHFQFSNNVIAIIGMLIIDEDDDDVEEEAQVKL